MSAIEWLPFISPFVWILLILNGLALSPLKLKARLPARVKLTLVFCIITLIGWLLALITVNVITPLTRVNLLALSKLLLVPSLIGLAITLIRHLIQGKNLLVIVLKGLARFLKPCVNLLILAMPFVLHFLAETFSRYTTDSEIKEEEEKKKPKGLPMNWRGDYIGRSKRHKY